MEVAKQNVRAVTARRKEKEKKAKGKEGASSSVPKAISKGSTKRKVDEKDDCPLKKFSVTLEDAYPKKSPPKSSRGMGKGVMTSSGLVIEGPHCLLTHKDYAIEKVESFIKLMDIDPCAQLGMEDLGASALFDLTQALVHVKALQDRCVAKEGVVTWVRKHNDNLLDQQGQYKEVVYNLNTDLKEMREKLEGEVCQKAKLEEELMTLCQQVEKAGVDAV
ncbi:uncharacterized protein LOC136066593 isoform X2 [Quercus suber]